MSSKAAKLHSRVPLTAHSEESRDAILAIADRWISRPVKLCSVEVKGSRQQGLAKQAGPPARTYASNVGQQNFSTANLGQADLPRNDVRQSLLRHSHVQRVGSPISAWT